MIIPIGKILLNYLFKENNVAKLKLKH